MDFLLVQKNLVKAAIKADSIEMFSKVISKTSTDGSYISFFKDGFLSN
jgi:hypothetical protein